MGQLRATSDHVQGVFDVTDASVRLGRGKDCDIQLPHRSVSRHHADVTESENRLRIVDQGSSIGTYVNGHQITDAYAEPGDKIRFGRVIMVYELEMPSSIYVPPVQTAPPVSQPNEPAAAAPLPQAPVVEAKPPVRTPPASLPPAAAPAPPPAEKPSFNLQPSAPQAPRPPSKLGQKPEREKWTLPAQQRAKAQDAAEKANQREAERQRRLEENESAPTGDGGAPAAVNKPAGTGFNRLHGGHQRKKKAARADYNAEASDWEDQVAAMQEGGAIDYAAEDEEWEQVWGKQKKRRGGMFFGGGGPLGALFGIFAGLGLKSRMMVMLGGMLLMVGVAKFGYDKATSRLLVPKPSLARKADKAKLAKTDGKTTGTDAGDKVLGKAMDTFKKIIPKTDD